MVSGHCSKIGFFWKTSYLEKVQNKDLLKNEK